MNIYLQPSSFSQITVGQKQYLICSVFVPPNVDPDVVELAWLNEEDIITADSRVTIVNSADNIANSSLNFNTDAITTAIEFNPLYENDAGNYICYSTINGSSKFRSVQLQNFRST